MNSEFSMLCWVPVRNSRLLAPLIRKTLRGWEAVQGIVTDNPASKGQAAFRFSVGIQIATKAQDPPASDPLVNLYRLAWALGFLSYRFGFFARSHVSAMEVK